MLALAAYQGSPFGPTAVQAATITVDTTADENDSALFPNGFCALREAINNANNDDSTNPDCTAGGGNDTIIFDATAFAGGATIALSLDLQPIADVDGLTIEGANLVTIDGDGFQLFVVNSGVPLTLNDLVVTGGQAANGGGIFNDGGTVTLSGSAINENSATNAGGGVFNGGGTLNVLDGSLIDSNSATNSGGGIANFSSGITNVTDSTISGNMTGGVGGGIANGSGPVTLLRSTVSGNSTTGGNGGGLYNSSQLSLTNSTVSGNSTAGSGGGIHNVAGTTNLISSTITDNTAANLGGGIHDESILTVNLTSSIVADNTPTDCGGPLGDFVSNGFNLDSDDTCELVAGGDLPADTANLGPLQDNGGPTETHELLAGSQAINGGDTGVCGDESSPFDQRGAGFNRIEDSRCDIGAFEVQLAPPPPPEDEDEEDTQDDDFEEFPTATPTRTPTPVPTATPAPVATQPSGNVAAISPPATGDGGLR
jgi:CSLREA domain-containing protein